MTRYNTIQQGGQTRQHLIQHQSCFILYEMLYSFGHGFKLKLNHLACSVIILRTVKSPGHNIVLSEVNCNLSVVSCQLRVGIFQLSFYFCKLLVVEDIGEFRFVSRSLGVDIGEFQLQVDSES